MYNELMEALGLAGKDESVITVITGEVLRFTVHLSLNPCAYPLFNVSEGSGDYYCSGNDLNNFTKIPEGGLQKMAEESGELLR